MKNLYPDIEPYKTEMLKVSDLHTIYVEQSGNPEGLPVIFLHGGPGGGSQPSYRRYFNPEKFRIIIFDQRGCGQSTPFAELEGNTTWDLVEDIQKIKNHLNIDQWAVFGGSWGSTLSLAYAQTYPESVTKLFLRGIFLLRDKEIHWFYQEGCSKIYPDAWEGFLEPIPEEERHDLVHAYYKRLTDSDESIRRVAAVAWSRWEGSTSKLIQDESMMDHYSEDEFAEAFARIECHYFINKGFFTAEKALLNNIDKIKHIPCVIVQGRYDVVCPMESAWELHKAWPDSKLIVVNEGHSLSEKQITAAFIEETDNY